MGKGVRGEIGEWDWETQTTIYKINKHQSEWPPSKNLQTVNAGEGVEKREPFYVVGGNVNWYHHCGKQYRGFLEN